VAQGDASVGVVRCDHLALLGQLQPAFESPGRQPEDPPIRRSPAPPDRPAPAVEQRQLDAMCPRGCAQRGLRLVKQPVRGEVARLLVRVGVAEHDLLPVSAPAEVLPIGRLGQDRVVLEQRDHIEDRRRVGGRSREPKEPGHVPGLGGERDDVPPGGGRPEASLQRRHRPERLDDLLRADARGSLAAGVSVVERRLRRAMGGAVLADLESREVEPEGRELPAEVGDVSPGDSRQAVRHQGLLDLHQLGIQLSGIGVAAGQRGGLAGEVSPGPAEPLCDEPESLPVRLVGEAPAELAVEIREQLRVAGEPRHEGPRHRLRRRCRGDGLGQPGGDGLVAA